MVNTPMESDLRRWMRLVEDQESWADVLQKIGRNPKFRVWFGQSVVRDDDNNHPEICFHWGTGNWVRPKPFTHFGTSDAAEMRFLDKKEFFSSKQQTFDPGHTGAYLLAIQKPYWIKDLGRHSLDDYVRELVAGSLWEKATGPLINAEDGEKILALPEINGWTALAAAVLKTGH